MCWLLHHIYNRNRSSKFVLSGTHGTLFPWLPPPGLPDAILIELREALLTVCKTFTPHCSESSSSTPIGVSSDVDISNFLQTGFLRLRGSEARD